MPPLLGLLLSPLKPGDDHDHDDDHDDHDDDDDHDDYADHDNNDDDHEPPQAAPWGWKHGLASAPLLTLFLDTPVFNS